MPITFNSAGGFLNGTISSSNGDIFITTSGSVGSINIGQQLQLTGSQVIEKDSDGNIRNKKTFNADGSVTQEKFDTGGKTTETKVKDPDKGKEFIRSGSATSNQIEFSQNAAGALIIASGSNPGFVAFMNNVGDRSMRARGDVFASGSGGGLQFCSTGVAMNGSSLDYYIQQQHLGALGSTQVFGDSNGTGFLMVSQSGDTRVSNNLIVDGGISATSLNVTSITSSIVTSSILQTEGSNIFGDTISDTHLFNGHITASGEISSSDRVIAKRFNADGTLEGAGGYAFRFRDDTGMYEEGFNVGVLAPENVQIAIDSNNNNNDISDPAQFVIVHNNAVLDSSPASPLFQVFEDGRTLFSTASVAGVTINHSTGHITASGDISASGTITAISMSGDGSTLTGITSTLPTGVVSSSGFNFTGTGTFNDDITIVEGKSIIFDSTDTFIKSNTDNPEDLQIAADEDIFLSPDDNLFIQHGSTTWVTFDGDNRKVTINGALNLSQSAGIGSSFEAPTTAVHTLRFDSDRFRFWAGGSERLTILSASGNIGIGTSAPVSALHVEEGDIRIDTAENGTQALRFSDRNTTKAQIQYKDDGETLNILTGGSTNAITIDNTQKVGIGTTSPQTNLDISASNPEIALTGPADNTGSIAFGDNAFYKAGRIEYMHGDNVMVFKNSSTERMRITNSEVVVSTDLQVGEHIEHVGDTNTRIKFEDDKITLRAGGVDMITLTEDSIDTIEFGARISSPITASGGSKFGTTSGTTNTSHQFAGISGDTNFFLMLDADGEEVMKGEGSVGGGNLKYTFGDNAVAGNGTLFQVDEGNNKFILHNDSNNSKVGINTTAPTKALQVLGEISASSTITSQTGFVGKTQNTGSYDFPGAIVGYNVQGLNVGHASYSLTTTMAVPDAGLNVCFVAPKSGIVEIEVQIYADGGSSGVADLVLGLSDNATYNAVQTYYEQGVLGFPRFDHMEVVHKWVVPSLTPGTTYKYWLGAKSTNTTGTPSLGWGGSTSGRFSDFIMKATALPSNTEIET